MSVDPGYLLLFLAMGLVVFGARALGFVAMRWLPEGGIVERFLAHLPGAVIISIVLGAAAKGGVLDIAALVVVVLLAALRLGAIAAMAVGVALVAVARSGLFA